MWRQPLVSPSLWQPHLQKKRAASLENIEKLPSLHHATLERECYQERLEPPLLPHAMQLTINVNQCHSKRKATTFGREKERKQQHLIGATLRAQTPEIRKENTISAVLKGNE